jgi:hypothetical protein
VRTTSVLAVTGALLALAAAPATAERWHGRDAKQDVRAYDIDITSTCDDIIEKAVLPHDRRRDITRLSVDHGADSVVVILALRDVGRHDRETSYDVAVRTRDRLYDVEVYTGRRGKAEVDFASLRPVRDPDAPECGRVLTAHARECVGLVADLAPAANTLTVTIPRPCLGDPGWVRVGAASGGFDIDSLSFGATVVSVSIDTWGPRGSGLSTLVPPLGPRVTSS